MRPRLTLASAVVAVLALVMAATANGRFDHGTSTAPRNTATPTIHGDATVGSTLTATTGTWSGTTPMTFTYHWQRCAAAGCVSLAATRASYTVVADDAGNQLRVRVTARNQAGRSTAASARTAPVTSTPSPPPPPASSYPLHTNIVSTTFWVGEIFDASLADGSQVCSTYDSQWAYHWSGGLETTTDPSTDCAGAPVGGCDGVPSGSGANFSCATEKRTAANNYFPTSPLVHPAENPFYLDLPYDDINDPTGFTQRCSVIPWASQYPASDCTNSNFSYMKNRWVKITGPNGNTCYGQIEDAGPSSGSLYHDSAYVFGSTDARPLNKKYSGDPTQGAGMDVSPALNGCLGFKELDGDDDHVSWQFVDDNQVPTGPWKIVVTTSQVTE